MTTIEAPVLTGQQKIDRAAREHGWISNGGASTADSHRECVYRLPGTPAYASVAYSHTGVLLWAGGRDAARLSRHFDGIGKEDRLLSFITAYGQ